MQLGIELGTSRLCSKVFPKLTVEETLQLGAFTEKSQKVVRERLANVYEVFPRLLERRTQRAGLMSGGEQAMIDRPRDDVCAKAAVDR